MAIRAVIHPAGDRLPTPPAAIMAPMQVNTSKATVLGLVTSMYCQTRSRQRPVSRVGIGAASVVSSNMVLRLRLRCHYSGKGGQGQLKDCLSYDRRLKASPVVELGRDNL
jgi:hypothetical protein